MGKDAYSLDDQGSWAIDEHQLAAMQQRNQPLNPILSLFNCEETQVKTLRSKFSALQHERTL